MTRSVCIIFNPHANAGRSEKLLPSIESGLRARGVPFRVERTKSIDHARELARETAERGEVAAAMGGDGLTGAIAGELCGTEGVMGVIPAGRGNDFARALGVTKESELVCETLASGMERKVDVAVANGRPYLGICSAGIDSDIQVIANNTRIPMGDFVYIYGTLRALATWKPANWRVTLDGVEREFSGYSVAVANSGVFGGGMWLTPDAKLDDGLLDVLLCEAVPKRRYLRNLPRVFKGTHLNEPGVILLQAREIRFEADRPFTAFADGDALTDLPATVQVRPAALRVLVPAK